MKKKQEFSCLFGHNIIFNGLYQAIRNIIGQMITELVLLLHKEITKLILIWSNMSQKCFKVLISIVYVACNLLLIQNESVKTLETVSNKNEQQ